MIQHTGDGIVISGYNNKVTRIGGNNLLSTSDGYVVRLDPIKGTWALDVDATENYWGSGDRLEIAENIYDGMDTWSTLDPKYYHGRVVFEPFAVDSIHAAGTRSWIQTGPGKSLVSKRLLISTMDLPGRLIGTNER